MSLSFLNYEEKRDEGPFKSVIVTESLITYLRKSLSQQCQTGFNRSKSKTNLFLLFYNPTEESDSRNLTSFERYRP